MNKTYLKIKQHRKKLILLLVVLLIIGISFWCRSLFYPADALAQQALSSTEKVTFEETSDYFGFISQSPLSSSAFILYPGALVDADAYAPLMADLADHGITSFIAKMPFDLALLRKDAADVIINDHPAIKNWYIGGHSLGGVMAANYANEHPELIKGIAFLASYTNTDLTDHPFQILSIYGSEDKVLNRTAYEKAQALLPTAHFNELILEGGNHANFGNYGEQAKDGIATLTNQKQQDLTVHALIAMITENPNDTSH